MVIVDSSHCFLALPVKMYRCGFGCLSQRRIMCDMWPMMCPSSGLQRTHFAIFAHICLLSDLSWLSLLGLDLHGHQLNHIFSQSEGMLGKPVRWLEIPVGTSSEGLMRTLDCPFPHKALLWCGSCRGHKKNWEEVQKHLFLGLSKKIKENKD